LDTAFCQSPTPIWTVLRAVLLTKLKDIAAIRSDGNILPQPAMTVHSYTFDEGDVIVVEVQPAHFPPVRYKGTIWIRVDPRRGIANEMEERLLTEKRTSNAKTFDERPCFGSTIDDLNITLFKMVYLPKAVNADVLANDRRDIKLQLASLRFYDLVYDCPTNAGILMFGNNVRYFFPMAYVQYT
jgi:ATP-dependent DNA helicase RecG